MRHLTVKLPYNSFRIYPVNDVQVGNEGYDEKRFKDYCKRIGADDRARVLGLGDYTDGLSPSNRAAIKRAQVDHNWYDVGDDMLRVAAQGQVNRFLKAAKPIKGKVDGMLKGHHFYEYIQKKEDGASELRSTDLDIAAALEAPYLDDTSDKKQMALITYRAPAGILRVLALHGEGSGATLASPLNRLTRMMASFQADVYMIAHHHKVFATKVPLLRSDPSKDTQLNHMDALMVGCGSWMRGYVEDSATYAEAGIMAPLAIGAPVIHVDITKTGPQLLAEV